MRGKARGEKRSRERRETRDGRETNRDQYEYRDEDVLIDRVDYDDVLLETYVLSSALLVVHTLLLLSLD